MTERLAELQRQRALLQEHLAWLERELAAEAAKTGAAVPPSPSPPPRSAAGSMSPAADPDAILAQYGTEPDALKTDVRKGCFLYFALAFVVLGLVLTALYFYTRSRH